MSNLEICSICLKNQENLTYTDETNAQDEKWSTKLTSCVPELEWNECKICSTCINKLEMVCEFRKLCFQSFVIRKRKKEYESDCNSICPLESDDSETKPCDSLLDAKFETTKLRDVESLLTQETHHKKTDDKTQFVCFHCDESFTDKSVLSNHIQTFHILKRCQICKNDFDDCQLENHLIEDHGIGKILTDRKIKTYKCDKCSKTYTTEKIMKIHTSHCDDTKKNNVDGKNLLLGDDNEIKLESFENVKLETKENCDVKPKLKRGRKPKEKQVNKCDKCGVIFTTRYLLNRHVRNVHATEKLYDCDICGQKFASPVYLSAHKRYHSRERPHICSFCGKGYITASDLYHHEKIHANKRAYKCEKCPKAFNTSSDLHKHKICVHVDRELWKYVCNFCNRRFPLKTNLDTHTKTHTGEKNFACHLCERRCINRSVLLRHIESHSNIRSFRCYVCNQEYKYQKSLDIHMTKAHGIGDAKIPERVKKYFCHVCPKSYFANNKLQKHIRTHTGERPFVCNVCEKKFVDKSYMKQHLKTAHNIS